MTLLNNVQISFESAIAILAGVVWLIRLEGVVKFQSKAVDKLEAGLHHLQTKQDAMEMKIAAELSSIRESVARIEGMLKNEQH